MKLHHIIASLTCIPGLFCFTACSSIVNSHTQKEEMMTAYLSGDHAAVEKELNAKLGSSTFSATGTGDELMWRLEAGGYFFLQGRDKESFTQFTRAQDLIEDYDSRAIVNIRQASGEGTTLMTNPNVLPYRGFCRDRILFPVYKALACLGMNDEDGFRVELYHLRETQDKVISEYEKYFKEEAKALDTEKEKNADAAASTDLQKIYANSNNTELTTTLKQIQNVANKGYGHFLNPFTIFMSGYGYLRDANYQNAIVDFERLYKAMPQHPEIRKYYAMALRLAHHELPPNLRGVERFHFSPGRNNVLVIFANGRSGALKQIALYLPVYYARNVTLATVAWPVCEYYDAPFQSLAVHAGGNEYKTFSLADMDGILSEEYTDRLPGTLTRIILSTAAKEIASYIAIEAARRQSPEAGLAASLTTSAYKAIFNTADTRSWEMLPKEFQVVQFPLPQDRSITFSLPGMSPRTVTFSPAAKSVILFVNAPSARESAVTYRIFELKTK